MKNNTFEEKIKKVCKEDIDIPIEFTNTIKNGLYNNYTRKNSFNFNIRKITFAAFVMSFIGVGMVLANNILNISENNGIKTALDYNYIQNIEMNYEGNKQIKLKIENLFIDDTSVGLVFSYKTDIKNINDIIINDLKIQDENHNIIYEDGNKDSLVTSFSREIAKDDNEFKQAIIFKNINSSLPKSSKFNISFSRVTLNTVNNKTKSINYDWNFDIDISDKFINRELILYKASESEFVKVMKAELMPTELNLELQFKNPYNAEFLYNNIKLQDENGKEYLINGEYSVENELTTPNIKVSFPISSFYTYEHLKLIINLDKEVIINLYK